MSMKPMTGAHFSTAGGLENAIYRAAEYGCPTLQLFTKSSRTWKEKILTHEEISRFNRAKKETGISKIISHASYLINIASNDPIKYEKSKNALQSELLRSSQLGIESLVLHPGSHLDQGEEKGIERVIETINAIFSENKDISTRLVIETTSGQGSHLGYKFEHIAEILDKTREISKTGACIDTCHIFAAGYDISSLEGCRKVFEEFDLIAGLDNLYVIHLNDSLFELGSKKDRHAHIGKGFIGDDAFKFIMQDSRLKDIPKILETPKTGNNNDTQDMDRVNLEKLQQAFKALSP